MIDLLRKVLELLIHCRFLKLNINFYFNLYSFLSNLSKNIIIFNEK